MQPQARSVKSAKSMAKQGVPARYKAAVLSHASALVSLYDLWQFIDEPVTALLLGA
jgi:hypothetical protein